MERPQSQNGHGLQTGSSHSCELTGLLSQHSAMLAASGVAPTVAEARGYRSVENPSELRRLGSSEKQALTPGLLVPIWGVGGEVALVHLRPDNPRMREGKPAKYEFPAGSRMAVDVHPHIQRAVRDPNVPLFITEGVKKADAAISRGLCCIALIGTWNWRGTNEFGGKTALPDWDFIALKDRQDHGRQVYICYDSDVMLKPQVHGALARLSSFLKKRGASVAYIYLPSGEGAAKMGLDDYLAVGYDVHDLLELASSELREIEGSARQPPSQATRLVDMAGAGVELWHTSEGEPYARILVDGHTQTWPLKSRAFRTWLSSLFYAETRSVPGSQAVQDALNALEGKAIYEGQEHQVFVRVARHDGDIWIDLANERWQAIRVTSGGWHVVDNPPVRFRRSKGMLPLPIPERGASVGELRDFVNVATDRDWALLLAFLVGVLKPEGPCPILAIAGEQGSAKSTLARLLRKLVDPSKAPLRSEPRNRQDLMIAASNSWLPTFDNLSAIPDWLSDDLCRLTSGGGFATRELYSDADETIFDVQRPVVLTSIEDIATRGDLLDRSIILTLAPIPPDKRRLEGELLSAFDTAQPRILGALCDALSTAMRNLPHTKLENPPRMADFSLWATAAEEGLGLEKGEFIRAHMGNRADANSLALEAEPVAARFLEFVESLEDGTWRGTASELLEKLNESLGPAQLKAKAWPKRADKLSGSLRRIAPNLRQQGIDVAFDDRDTSRKRSRQINIRRDLQSGVPGGPGVRGAHEASIGDRVPSALAGANSSHADAADATEGENALLPFYSSSLLATSGRLPAQDSAAGKMDGWEEI